MNSMAEMVSRHERVSGIESLHYAATPKEVVVLGAGLFSGPTADSRLYVFLSEEERNAFVYAKPEAFRVSRDQARVALGLQNFAPRFE